MKNKFEEIKLFIKNFNPAAICLQETFLLKDDKISFKNYTIYHYPASDANGKAGGGSMIMVRNDVAHTEIEIDSPLQAVAVTVSMQKKLNLCSVYIPPSRSLDIRELDNLYNQLPGYNVILGDFNAHNLLWGCKANSPKGDIVETFVSNNNLCILNDKSQTYLHPATGSTSAIDLTLVHPLLYIDFSWEVSDDLCGSDHFPIFISTNCDTPGNSSQSFKLNRANWGDFTNLCREQINPEVCDTLFNMSDFTQILQAIAEETIPKSKNKPTRIFYPWFNEQCKEAIKHRKKALLHFKRNPIGQNLYLFKIAAAKARRTIRQAKRDSWREYVSKLNNRTPIGQTWNIVRKISGKYKTTPLKYLNAKNNSQATTPFDIANTLGESFQENSSSQHYSPTFQKYKTKTERHKINFKSSNSEDYNKNFTIKELNSAIEIAKDTASGPDEIHYQMLKHLPECSRSVLLAIYNNIFTSKQFPTGWRDAIVIPIQKPGKDHTNPQNYRPIALTSCLCKIFERLLNTRLVYYLERHSLITELQAGFRKNRSTEDQLVRFETLLRESFLRKEHVVSVFFDLEKAYDTTWTYGILQDLFNMGLRGHLPIFIENFLRDRKFKVRVGSDLSDSFNQEVGVPQGSILSPTLFSIKINNIVKCLRTGIDASLYVDDFLISYHSRSMPAIERKLQGCLNKLEKWCEENGFKFSPTKTVCVHFCQRRGLHPDPSLILNGTQIPVVPQVKFLGVWFDRKLNFKYHIDFLKAKCLRALNLLRVVSKLDWGGDRHVLLRIYRSLIRSKLDYGCSIYGSARKSYLKKLDPIANQGLRLCLGAFRTSPVESLQAEAHEPPLSLRRERLSLLYSLRVGSNPKNPTYNSIFRPELENLFEAKPNAIPTFGIRVKPQLHEIGFNINQIEPITTSKVPPWMIQTPSIIFNLAQNKKSQTSPELYQS